MGWRESFGTITSLDDGDCGEANPGNHVNASNVVLLLSAFGNSLVTSRGDAVDLFSKCHT